MKSIQAINDRIVVELIIPDNKTEGGLILPNTDNKDPQGYGKVVSVGGDVTNVKVDDVVVFHRNGGLAIIIEKKIMKVLMEQEIYGILKEE